MRYLLDTCVILRCWLSRSRPESRPRETGLGRQRHIQSLFRAGRERRRVLRVLSYIPAS